MSEGFGFLLLLSVSVQWCLEFVLQTFSADECKNKIKTRIPGKHSSVFWNTCPRSLLSGKNSFESRQSIVVVLHYYQTKQPWKPANHRCGFWRWSWCESKAFLSAVPRVKCESRPKLDTVVLTQTLFLCLAGNMHGNPGWMEWPWEDNGETCVIAASFSPSLPSLPSFTLVAASRCHATAGTWIRCAAVKRCACWGLRGRTEPIRWWRDQQQGKAWPRARLSARSNIWEPPSLWHCQ